MSNNNSLIATTFPGRRRTKGGTRTKFGERDLVRTVVGVMGGEGLVIPAGSLGTVVTRWAHGAAFEVEFTGTVTALATVEPRFLELVQRLADCV